MPSQIRTKQNFTTILIMQESTFDLELAIANAGIIYLQEKEAEQEREKAIYESRKSDFLEYLPFSEDVVQSLNLEFERVQGTAVGGLRAKFAYKDLTVRITIFSRDYMSANSDEVQLWAEYNNEMLILNGSEYRIATWSSSKPSAKYDQEFLGYLYSLDQLPRPEKEQVQPQPLSEEVWAVAVACLQGLLADPQSIDIEDLEGMAIDIAIRFVKRFNTFNNQ